MCSIFKKKNIILNVSPTYHNEVFTISIICIYVLKHHTTIPYICACMPSKKLISTCVQVLTVHVGFSFNRL